MDPKWYKGVQEGPRSWKRKEDSMGLGNGLDDASGYWRGSEGSIGMKGGPGSVKV